MRKFQTLLTACTLTYMCACGDSGPSEADEAESSEAATAVASTVGIAEQTALENVRDILEQVQNTTGDGNVRLPGLGDFEFDYELECRNAADTVLDSCGPETSTIDVATNVSGTVTLPRIDGDFTRSASWRITLGESVTINGTSAVQATVQTTGPGGAARLTIEAAGELVGVTYNRLVRRFTSGTATLIANIERTQTGGEAEQSTSRTVEVFIDFAATTMTITVDGEHVFEFSRSFGS